MALSCTSQTLQRSCLVYFRQGAWGLSSCATKALFSRRPAFTSSAFPSFIARSPCQTFAHSLPVWRQYHSSSPFQFQRVRALSSSSLDVARAANALKEDEEDTGVVAAEEPIETVVEEEVEGALKFSQEEEVHVAVTDAAQEEIQEVLGSVDLLNDENRSKVVDSRDEIKLEERHPWSEWEQYLKMLEDGGHFEFETETTDRRSFVRQEDDAGKIKRASMAFARNRDDIFNTMSQSLLRILADFGCPSTDRKVVNAAKRLRVSLRIAEGDVCKPCDIRNSCERAYNKPANADAVSTQDVIRLLVAYAMLAKSSIREILENVESAAKNLLLESVRASEVPRDPSLPPPAPKAVSTPREPKERRRSAHMENSDIKPGDWKCPECSFVNFSRNFECRECQIPRPKLDLPAGDWQCQDCGFVNFSRNIVCRKCQTKNTESEIKAGDWACPRCRFHNFARNKVCFECRTERPQGGGSGFDRGDAPRRAGQWDRETARSSYGRSEERGRSSYNERGSPSYEMRGRPSYDEPSYERSSERGRTSFSRSEDRSRPSSGRSDVRERPSDYDKGFKRTRSAEGALQREKHEEWKPTKTVAKPSRFNFDISDGSDEDFANTQSVSEEEEDVDFGDDDLGFGDDDVGFGDDDVGFGDEEEESEPDERSVTRGRAWGAKRGHSQDRSEDWNSGVSKLRNQSEPPLRARNRRRPELSSSSGDDEEFDESEDWNSGVSKKRNQSEPPLRAQSRGRLQSSSGDDEDFEDFEDLNFGDESDDLEERAMSSSRGGRGGRGRGRGTGRGGSGAGRSRAPWTRDSGSIDFRGKARDAYSDDEGSSRSFRGREDSWSSDRPPSRGGRGGRGGRSSRGGGRSFFEDRDGGRGGGSRGGGRGRSGRGGRGGRGGRSFFDDREEGRGGGRSRGSRGGRGRGGRGGGGGRRGR